MRLRRPKRPSRESFRRGIFLLPSLFTVGNMLAGFASILHSIGGRLEQAGWLIFLAGILDGLDGRIARLTKSTSEFGKEYDSLADVVSFGVAPAVLAFQWGLSGMGRLGWVAAFLFVVAGSVRLARFNVRADHGDRRYFVGLPIPGGAGAVTLLVLIAPEPVLTPTGSLLVCLFVLTVALLMVSTIRYRSFKDLDLRQRWPAKAFFFIAAVLSLVAFSPLPAMGVMLGIYLLSGPVGWLLHRLRREPTASPPKEVSVGEGS
ncbi:MAG: CDP-diacylglycerol--serine O-phosphatidyltransferase [Thermoanaerobaculum sp.]|nr:MAG: CDP-diacylglycerol--serine O-phosphatidyltransferase [Thermoanaerobaculum sp.]